MSGMCCETESTPGMRTLAALLLKKAFIFPSQDFSKSAQWRILRILSHDLNSNIFLVKCYRAGISAISAMQLCNCPRNSAIFKNAQK
jgi:hypothetical protein